jgi:ATP-binding cassette subfamily B protein
VNGLLWPTMQFLLGGALLVILYIGGQDAIEGQLTIGQLVQFVAYLQLISWPMIALGEVTNLIQQGWASLGRLQQL